MKLVVFTVAFVFVSIPNAAAAKPSKPEIDCSLVRIDATVGAEAARAGTPYGTALLRLEQSYRDLDVQLVKAHRKPTSIATKTQAKLSFMDGYDKARENTDDTVERIAGKVGLACTFEKYK